MEIEKTQIGEYAIEHYKIRKKVKELESERINALMSCTGDNTRTQRYLVGESIEDEEIICTCRQANGVDISNYCPSCLNANDISRELRKEASKGGSIKKKMTSLIKLCISNEQH